MRYVCIRPNFKGSRKSQFPGIQGTGRSRFHLAVNQFSSAAFSEMGRAWKCSAPPLYSLLASGIKRIL